MHAYITIYVFFLMALSAVSCKPEHSRGFAYDSGSDYERLLVRLDKELVKRDSYVGARNARIDSLRMVREAASSGDSLILTVEIVDLYRGFLTDSALVECRRAERLAHRLEDSDMEFRMRLERIQQMPLVGFSHGAIAEFESFALDSLSNIHQAMALWAGRQMYSYIAAQFPNFPDEQNRWNNKATELQERLVGMLEPDSPDMLLNAGECEFMKGNDARAYAILTELLERIDINSNMAARVASLVGQISSRQGRVDESIHYLALSAIADVRSATREVTSLQQLGIAMYDKGEIERADYFAGGFGQCCRVSRGDAYATDI